MSGITTDGRCPYCLSKTDSTSGNCNTQNCFNGSIKYFIHDGSELKQVRAVTCSSCNGTGIIKDCSSLLENCIYIDCNYACSDCGGLGLTWQEVSLM